MSYLLDTNVISETVRPRPEPGVMAWLESVPNESLHTSALCLGEILNGIERLPPSARRERLRGWLEHDFAAWFEDRVLPFDRAVAVTWGRLLAATAARRLPAVDSLLAATALHHNLSLVTRNEADFARAGVKVINPWGRR